jgi:transaldolase
VGARPQRCLWASTSVKNPRYRDTCYAEELIGPGTIATLPLGTLAAFEAHGVARQTLPGDQAAARRVLDDFRRVGIDPKSVSDALERNGVQRFVASYQEALDEITMRSQPRVDPTPPAEPAPHPL